MIKSSLSSLCLAALLSLAAPGARGDDCPVQKLAELRVVLQNDQILIPAVIGGQQVNALFDTGFPTTIITSSTAARLGLTVTRVVEQNYFDALTGNEAAPGGMKNNGGMVSNDDLGWADIDELVLDKVAMKHARAGVIHSSNSFIGDNVAIVLGNDVWRDFDIEVDLSRGLITIYRANSCAPQGVLADWGAGYNVVDLAKTGPGTAFDVELNEHSLYAILDSGTPHSSLTEKAASRLRLDRPDSSPVIDDALPVGTLPTDLSSMIIFTNGFGLRGGSPNVKASSLADFGMPPPRHYWLARLDSLIIDQEVVSPLAMRVVPAPRLMVPETGERTHRPAATYDVLLGVDFFQSHRVLISHSRKKLYFSYNGDAAFAKP